jgi:hypothetical protein
MHKFSRSILIGAASFALFGTMATEALACRAGHCRIDQGATRLSARKGCGQLVTVMYPDLKGHARHEEFKKCMANPDTYSKL